MRKECIVKDRGENLLSSNKKIFQQRDVDLLAYDEQLRHYANMRITLDLDDGVKVNYGKFGDLLEGVKAVTGGAGKPFTSMETPQPWLNVIYDNALMPSAYWRVSP